MNRVSPNTGSFSKTSGLRSEAYIRTRDLPRLIGMWPDALVDISRLQHARLVQQIAAALRRERQRGRAGHFAYDLARHQQLLRAHQAEVAAFAARPILEAADSLNKEAWTKRARPAGDRPG